VEAHPFPVEKAFIIGKIEYLIGQFSENPDPEFIFKEILKLIDEHKIAEHKEDLLNMLMSWQKSITFKSQKISR
jgi:hypothetical protein